MFHWLVLGLIHSDWQSSRMIFKRLTSNAEVTGKSQEELTSIILCHYSGKKMLSGNRGQCLSLHLQLSFFFFLSFWTLKSQNKLLCYN